LHTARFFGAPGEVVAIDGKTARRTFKKAKGEAAIHVVTAYAVERRLVLGQVKTEQKSNEITAIPKLLDALDLQGATERSTPWAASARSPGKSDKGKVTVYQDVKWL